MRGLLEPCNGTGIAADDEEALAVGLGRRAEWLRRLDELADIAALPPTLRAERDLAPIEQRCLADLSADHAPPPEPAGLIRARRQEEHYADLEFAFKKAINQCSKRLENLRNARPLLWGRAEHSAALAAQQQRHNALQERIPHVIENARIWKNWRKTLQEARDSSEKKRIDQVQRTLAHAQMKLASVGQVRNVIKLSPKVVQWGGSTLYAMMIAIRQADFRHQAGADSTHVDVDPDYEVHIDIWGVAQLPAP